ncbi:MAG: hypothetical protein ACR2FK_03705 [Sphingomicrobium sp.]
MVKTRAEWFAPKRYGFGVGWPIAWQGRAILAGFVAAVVAAGLLFGKDSLQALVILAPMIAALLIITARTTRGGWRWRWGEME